MGYGKAKMRVTNRRSKRTKQSPAEKVMTDLYDFASEVESEHYVNEAFESMGDKLTDAAQYNLETSDDKQDVLDMLLDARDEAEMLKYEAESYMRRILKFSALVKKVKVIPAEKKIVNLSKAEVEVMKRRVARKTGFYTVKKSSAFNKKSR